MSVSDTIKKEALRDSGHFLLRIGRLKCYLDAKERLILRHVYRFSKDSYTKVIKAYEVTFKRKIVKKILKEHKIKN